MFRSTILPRMVKKRHSLTFSDVISLAANFWNVVLAKSASSTVKLEAFVVKSPRFEATLAAFVEFITTYVREKMVIMKKCVLKFDIKMVSWLI